MPSAKGGPAQRADRCWWRETDAEPRMRVSLQTSPCPSCEKDKIRPGTKKHLSTQTLLLLLLLLHEKGHTTKKLLTKLNFKKYDF